MKIGILTQYYPPEVGAPQRRLSELCDFFLSRGHEVVVYTTFPSYPNGKLIGKKRQIIYSKKENMGLTVFRTYSYFCESPSKFDRLLSQITFCSTSLLICLISKKPDILLVESPPLFLGLTAFIISKIKRIPFIFHVSDLWPESIEELGALKNTRVLDILYAVERFIYKKANAVVAVTKGIHRSISKRGFSRKTVFIPNGVESDKIFPIERRSKRFMKKFGIEEGDFVLLYAGTFGLSHPLGKLIEVFRKLSGLKGLKMIMIGSGPGFEEMKKKSEKIEGMSVFEAVEHKNMNDLLSICDLEILALKPLKLFLGALPSKVYEANSAGKPVFCLLKGEIEEYFKCSKGGKNFGFNDIDGMAESIRYFYHHRDELQKMGQNGRDFVVKNYDRKIIGEKYLRIFEVIRENGKP